MQWAQHTATSVQTDATECKEIQTLKSATY